MEKVSEVWDMEFSNFEKFRKDGFQIVDIEKYQSLLHVIESQLVTNQNNLNLLNKKIVILDILGRYEDALKCIEEIFQIDNKNYLATINKVMALIGLKRYEDALNYLDKFLIHRPKDDFMLYTKAVVLELLARHDDSLLFFFNSLKVDETNYNEMLKIGSYLVNEYNATDFSGKIMIQDNKVPLNVKLVDFKS